MTGQRPLPVFPNYTQVPRRVPLGAWDVVRGVVLLLFLAEIALLGFAPDVGLPLFWKLTVPVLPAVWLLAPGLWRNACPLAASNQLPRRFELSRALPQPEWLRRHAHLIGIAAVLTLVPLRRVVFNHSGPATAALLLAVATLAFAGGLVFKGKSGWCSSVCPLLPVQRLYGQAPAVLVPNSHCQPCVGCTKNCYDFNPGVAHFADHDDDDEQYAGYRRFFAGVFPGLVVAFFTLEDPASTGVGAFLAAYGLALLVSLGSYYAIVSIVPLRRARVTAAYGAAGFSLFYWFGAPVVASGVEDLFGWTPPDAVVTVVRVAAIVAAVAFVVRAWRRDADYLVEVGGGTAVRVAATEVLRERAASDADAAEVTFEDEFHVAAQDGQSLLELAEALDLAIEPGCRMGVCGADPVAILDGLDALSEVGDDEASTLDRLGFAPNTRMACMARVRGDVAVGLQPQPRDAAAEAPTDGFDRSVEQVVILGNGIAGITVADHVRRRHPDCEIHVVSREPHHLYNRMAISRLIYGRTALHGLFLQPDAWYDEHRITCWLNTEATRIDREQRVVTLATGEELPYDRLVLATGSHSFVPPAPGTDLPGVFVVREASDAAAIRRYRQDHDADRVVVVGGGLLGLEVAYALKRFGLQTTVLERGPGLLRRQLDARAGALLGEHLAGLGIEVVTDASLAEITGTDRVEAVSLEGGAALAADLVVMAAGVRPNVELAAAAGLEVERGVVVDDHLRTSDPAIYAVGDVAEHAGRVYGLWPAAVDQARVAATNLVAEGEPTAAYAGTVPATMLKVVGVDVASYGRVDPEEGDEVVVLDLPAERRYVRLLVNGGRAVGAVLYGAPDLAAEVAAAVKGNGDAAPLVAALDAQRPVPAGR